MAGERLIAGLDLGKAADFSVLSVVGRRRLDKPVAKRRYAYALRWLQAWDLGTKYNST
jgi:phage terminase large subunit-like protein